MFTKAASILFAIASVQAGVFLTAPVASSTLTGGQKFTITWQDDGKAPTLKDFGAAKISIYAGNAQQQTELQPISPSTDVSTASSFEFTPDAKIGPNSNQYFIRLDSLNLKDAANPQFAALAFSAKFTMSGMSGTFSPAVQAQIDGQTTAPLGGATAAGATTAGATTAGTPTTAPGSSRPASSTSRASSSASASASARPNNGAASLSISKAWFGVIAGVVVGVLAC